MSSHRLHFLQEFFGIRKSISQDEYLKNGQAILIVAGVDGISDSELEYAICMFEAFGAPAGVLEELRHFDYKNADLEDYMVPGGSAPPRVILYMAMKIARADGHYGEAERESMLRGAELLGMERSAVATIENVVRIEEDLRALRVSLLYP
jgi:uncharacterized tellurite resistance protein B-like protein